MPFFASAQLPSLVPYRSDTSWGFSDTAGNIQIEPVYDGFSFFENGFARVRVDTLWGLVNRRGELVVPPQFDELSDVEFGLVAVARGREVGIYDTTGQEIVPVRYHDVVLAEGLLPVMRYNRWGYCNREGIRVIGLNFDQASAFRDGVAYVLKNDRAALIDSSGKDLTAFTYQKLELKEDSIHLMADFQETVMPTRLAWLLKKYQLVATPSEGLIRVAVPGNDSTGELLWGLVDSTGREVLKPTYRYVDDFREGRTVYRSGERFGYLDTAGREIISARYTNAFDFKDGLALTRIKKGFGFVNPKGKKVIGHQFREAREFSEGFAAVSSDPQGFGDWAFVDKKGKYLTDLRFNLVLDFADGHAIVSKRDQKSGELLWGLLNREGKLVVPCRYVALFPMSSGRYLAANEKERLGIIDTLGKALLPFKFSKVEPTDDPNRIRVKSIKAENEARAETFQIWEWQASRFQLAVAAERVESDRPVVTLKLDHYRLSFENGYSVAVLDGKSGVIDSKGDWTIEPKYDELRASFAHGFIAFRKGKKWGLMNLQEQEIFPSSFKDVRLLPGGLAFVKIDTGRFGFVDRYGRKYFD